LFQIHESGSVSGSLVLTVSKNNNFTIIGGTKINHGPSSRDTSRTQRPSIKIFFKPKIYYKFGYFCLFSQFSANFGFEAKFENLTINFVKFSFEIVFNFNRIICNKLRFQNVILHQNRSTGSEDIFNWISSCQKTCEID
jgi:hypothetical protein